MFKSHFGFQNCPFTATPDATNFVQSETLHKVMSDVRFCIESGQGIAVITGDAGVGKTTVCHKLADDLGNDFTPIILPNSNYSDRTALLQSILFELGRKYVRLGQQELRLELVSTLRSLSRQNDRLVLIADEAETLSIDLLNELRTLASLTKDGQPLLRLVLSGQMALEETLLQPQLAALNQRIRCQTWIPAMNSAESRDYIAAQFRAAGQTMDEIVDEDALKLIVQASNGLPRCINQLCNQSLRVAYLQGEQTIAFSAARIALDDLVQLPLQWNDPGSESIEVSTATESHASESTSSFTQSDDGSSAVFEIGAKEVSAAVAEFTEDEDEDDDVTGDESVFEDLTERDFETVSFAEMSDDSPVISADSDDQSNALDDDEFADEEMSDDEYDEDYEVVADNEEDIVIESGEYENAEIYAISSPDEVDDGYLSAGQVTSPELMPVSVLDDELRLVDESVDSDDVDVDADGFHEEIVYDRYAYIDAGRSNFIVDNDDVFDQLTGGEELAADDSRAYVPQDVDIESIGFADEAAVEPTTVACDEIESPDDAFDDVYEESEDPYADESADSSEYADNDAVQFVDDVATTVAELDETASYGDSDDDDYGDVNLAEACDEEDFDYPDTVVMTDNEPAIEADTLPMPMEEEDSFADGIDSPSIPLSLDSAQDDQADSVIHDADDAEDSIVAILPNDEIYDVVEPAHTEADELNSRAYSNLFSRLKKLQERQQRADAS